MTITGPRSLLPTLDAAEDAAKELVPIAAVDNSHTSITSSVSVPSAKAAAEAPARTTTLPFTMHERVKDFFIGDIYKPIRETVNPLLRGLVKKIALNIAADMDFGEGSATRPPPKFKSAHVIWKEQPPVPPPNASKSIELFLACIMSEIAINSAVSLELPNLPDEGETYYMEQMRLGIKHLKIHLINEPVDIKKYWKNEASNQILVLLSEANALLFGSTPSPKKRIVEYASPGVYSCRSAPTPSSAETILYEPDSPTRPITVTPLRDGYISRPALKRKTSSMIEIGLETEEAVRRNLAASLADEQVDSSPDKPLSDEAAAERLQWQEWQEWNGEGEGYGKEVEPEQGIGGTIEKHPDQDPDDEIVWDHSLFNRIDLVDTQGNITPNCLNPMLRYVANGKLSSVLRHSLCRLAGMKAQDADFFATGQAVSMAQATSESWCKLHTDEVINKFQNSMCPTHPPSKVVPVKPANCRATMECGCGGVATLRLVQRDFLNDRRKGIFPKSMGKGFPYFTCGREFSAGPPCSMGKSALVVCAMTWLVDQYELASTSGDYRSLTELFQRTDSIGSRIVQAYSVGRTELHRRTVQYRPEIEDDNPDRATTKKDGNIRLMMENMTPARASNAPGKGQSIPRSTPTWGVPATAAVEQNSSDGGADGYPLPTDIVSRFRRLTVHNLNAIQYEIEHLDAAYLTAELGLKHGMLQSLLRR